MCRNVLVAAVVLMVVGAGVAAVGYAQWVNALEPVDPISDNTVLVQVEPGSSTADIAAMLEEENLIRSGWAFVLLARVQQRDGQARAGWYELHPAMTPEDILDKLIRGEAATMQFTIPEGLTVQQVVDRMVAQDMGEEDAFWAAVHDEEVIDLIAQWLPEEYAPEEACPEYELPSSVLEGYLYPDTYTVDYGLSEAEMVQMVLNRFLQHWDEERAERAEEMDLSPHEVVTLASIVEREARVDDERPKIASVFLNRLEREMLLGACSTVLYVQGRFSGPVLDEDTEIDSPYNTYRAADLPPGPIASPGQSSIDAVLNPDSTDYLYFVSRGDGTHAFARTYDEHLQNVAEYGE